MNRALGILVIAALVTACGTAAAPITSPSPAPAAPEGYEPRQWNTPGHENEGIL